MFRCRERDQVTLVMVCLKDQKSLHQNEIFPDKFMRREILAIVVHCTFMEDGCIWKGEVRYLESHMNTCEFLKIPCVHPECGVLVKKSELTLHLERECMYRLEKCTFCQRQIVLSRMREHQEKECPSCPVTCEKCNKDGIQRSKLKDHQNAIFGDCEAVQGPCPFSQIDCPKTDVLNQKEKKSQRLRKNEERVNVTYSTNSKVEVVALVVGGAVAVVVLKVAVAAVVVAVEVVTLEHFARNTEREIIAPAVE
ncbi:TNF receptor-associated factor 6-like [Stylophora pistillata]|uniref:TNF receptor-associated factor 6-like n=1 Tax=Stylophora pistillata TaxID=50429 RepID=UPI000C03E0CC|nr:TNF receptor-associated factor 6-like [Stylophora pistillata]